MNQNYCDILDRLLLYRRSLDKTQEEMSRQFGITQSHYSKIEAGSKIISFQGLENFGKHGGDVSYLLTGERQVNGEIEIYINRCRTARSRKSLYKIIVWLLWQGIELSRVRGCELAGRSYRSLRLVEIELEEPAVWKNIRRLEGISQEKMAERLDINIKRYGRIENGGAKPDAEIMNTLYTEFGYSPLIFLDVERFYANETNKIWNGFTEDVRAELEAVLKDAICLIGKCESI